MIFNFLNLGASFLNLIAVAVLLYFLVKNYRVVRRLTSENFRLGDRYYDDLLERIQRIEKNHQAQTTSIPDSGNSGAAVMRANRIKSAITSLRNGRNPEEIRKEYGYSGSEMGLIAASANMTAGEIGHIDPSVK